MDVLGAEEEELTSMDDVSHVIIGAEATIGDKHGFGGNGQRVAIDNGTESAVLILLRDGLDNSVRITTGIQVMESSQVDTVDAFSGIALGSEIIIGGELRTAQEGECRAIGGEEAVIEVRGRGLKRLIEAIEDITECSRTQFGPFLNKSGCGWMVFAIGESID
jgi:hypothetical protein